MGDKLKVRVAMLKSVPIASILTLEHEKSVIYKYACSHADYHRFGGITFLLWRAIRDAKLAGFETFDLGRSDCDNIGLINFKEHWGSDRRTLEYWAYPARARFDPNHHLSRAARSIFSVLPKAMLPLTGRLLYRHMG
jgi:hypothetical protein